MKALLKCMALSALMNIFTGCAATSVPSISAVEQQKINQNIEEGLPPWAGCSFTSRVASFYMDGYKPREAGVFASASGETERSANLAARAELVRFIYPEENTAFLAGSRRVDSFTADDGTVWVLMFVSEKDISKRP